MNQDSFQNEERSLDSCLELLSAYGVPMPESKLLISTAVFLTLPEETPVSQLPEEHKDIVIWHVRDVHAWCWRTAMILDKISPPPEVSQAFREIG